MPPPLRSQASLDEVFSPSTPVSTENYFVGRYHELKALLHAIDERGKHILLYGDRGVGKTSLANIMTAKCQAKNKDISIYQSSAIYAMDFDEIWSSLLEQVNDDRLRETLENRGKRKFDVRSLVTLFSKIWRPIVFIIDEFDIAIQKEENKKKFAVLTKALSDSCPHITMVFIGVANNANELVDLHASLERCLVEFHLPRMQEREILDLLEGGGRKVGLNFQEEVKKQIVSYSVGYPYFAHLLAKHCCEHAVSMHYNAVTVQNFREGLKNAITSSKTLLKKQMQKAVAVKNPLYKELLMLTATQEDENIDTEDLKKQISNTPSTSKRETRLSFYLSQLTQKKRGEVLEKVSTGEGETTYRFKSPLLRTYLRMEMEKENTKTKKPSASPFSSSMRHSPSPIKRS